jgi:hypothetical protein
MSIGVIMKTYELIAKYNLKEHIIRVQAKNKKDAIPLFIVELKKLYSYLSDIEVNTVFNTSVIYRKSYLVKE